MSTNPSNDERLMAAIAHASVVVFGPGLLVGVLIWLTQKEKAAYASGQGLQAAVYQLIGMILSVALWVVWSVFYALSFIPIIQNPQQFEAEPPAIFWIAMASMVIPLVFMVVWGLYGLWAALRCLGGRDFRYAVIGRLLPVESSEDG